MKKKKMLKIDWKKVPDWLIDWLVFNTNISNISAILWHEQMWLIT